MRLREGICARLPQHYLASLQDDTPPTPVHWEPHGLRYRRNPRTGQRERVQDVPVPVYFPPAADEGLWGGEGWIRGFRYARGDKVSAAPFPEPGPPAPGPAGASPEQPLMAGPCPALHQAPQDVEAAAVQAAVLQRDPGRDADHHRHHAHA